MSLCSMPGDAQQQSTVSVLYQLEYAACCRSAVTIRCGMHNHFHYLHIVPSVQYKGTVASPEFLAQIWSRHDHSPATGESHAADGKASLHI